MVKGNFSSYKSEHALRQLNEWGAQPAAPLVQIATPARTLEETNA
jgi:hypothetical protein